MPPPVASLAPPARLSRSAARLQAPPSGSPAAAKGIARGSVAARTESSETIRATGVPEGDSAAVAAANPPPAAPASGGRLAPAAASGNPAGSAGAAADSSGTRNRAPHSGQMPLRPAKCSLTLTRCPCGQKAMIPIGGPTAMPSGSAATTRAGAETSAPRQGSIVAAAGCSCKQFEAHACRNLAEAIGSQTVRQTPSLRFCNHGLFRREPLTRSDRNGSTRRRSAWPRAVRGG